MSVRMLCTALRHVCPCAVESERFDAAVSVNYSNG